MANIFQNDTKSLPKRDAQIVRISMEKDEMTSGQVPKDRMGGDMAIQHVPNAGGKN